MDDLERQLRKALVRKEAPPGLEARVRTAAALPRRRAWSFWPARFRWPAAAAAAALAIAGVLLHERAVNERTAGEAARDQLMLALQITSSKLQTIQAKVEAVSDGHEDRSR
jgi:hypothetical protein